MRVHIASDLHLEIGPPPTFPGGDILLLCGDTFVVRRFNKRAVGFLQTVSKQYDRILVLIGNHESYDGVIDDTPSHMRTILKTYAPNATLLDNQVATIGGVSFVGSTLWAPCRNDNPFSEIEIARSLNDFRLIATLTGKGNGTRRFTTADARKRHEESVAWLTTEIPKHKKVVVMTHHAPSLRSNTKYHASGQWGGDLLTPAYCSDLERLILANPHVSHWVHGHTHQQASYSIGPTKVITNQRGYVGHEAIAKEFDPERGAFEIETEGVSV